MKWLEILFILCLSIETGVRLWLSTRQLANVRAHRDRVPDAFVGQIPIADHQKAADYTLARVAFGRWAVVSEGAFKAWLTVGGGLAAIDALVLPLGLPEPWAGTLLVLLVFAVIQAFGLPFSMWRTFRIEARFGFNRISPSLFLLDLSKRLLLGVLLGAPLAWVTIWLMGRAGALWWTWAWGLYVAVTLVMSWAAPRFIAPLFNRFTAISDDQLKQRVAELVRRCGFSAEGGVFVMDGSRRSAHGNAYFTGIGRNKRIVFFDTLLSRIGLGEVEAVLAHELGHFRLNHVRQRLITSLIAALAGFALLRWFATRGGFYAAFGVAPSSAMALLLFVLIVPTFTFFGTPFGSWWSRRQEMAADDFALSHADGRDLINALVKLYRDNASTLTPDPLHSAFYDSHPPAAARIGRLRRLVPLST